MSKLTELLKQKSLTIAVAESCTGGNLSALLTSESGSSEYFDRGFITY
ncbi:MAG: CinA family protein, partial [Gammaproteobacteria bacterium]|nr:CinA family protein [Gammaproteobacteria bacterium]